MAYIPSFSTRSSQSSCISDPSLSRASHRLSHPDLITFLIAVQHRQIDFVPVTWQENLGLVGQGGTALISQAYINPETGFAFKRTFQHSYDRDPSIAYEVLIADILVLSHPAIRGHPNIVSLIGFCWEIRDGDQVCPVIVLEKAQDGDLSNWDMSQFVGPVSFEDKIGLCIDIANALRVLHDNNIVHGDLKPENVLVFTKNGLSNKTRKHTAKLTDFGYSSFGRKDEEVVYPCFSELWSAPECHDRGMKLQAVKKNEIFAFGLIAIHLLFVDFLGRNAVWEFYQENESITFAMKSTDKLLTRTLKIVSDKVHDEDQRIALQDFFRATLSLQPEQRELNMDVLTRLLESARLGDTHSLPTLSSQKLDTQWDDISHLEFSVSKSIFSLTMVEYQVREEIHSTLKRRISDPHLDSKFTCERCSVQSAFQLALCYQIGFGTPSDAAKSTDFLSISARGEPDLQNELVLLAQMRPEPFNSQTPLAKLWEEGFLFTQHSEFEDPNLQISDLETRCLREISDMDSVLGDDNAITMILKMHLAVIYEKQGNLVQAERTCRLALSSSIKVLGNLHITTLECMTYLARVLWETRNLLEAEWLQQCAAFVMMDLLGKNHIHTTRMVRNWCDTLELEGRFKRVVSLRHSIYHGLESVLGLDHPEVVVAMDKMAISKRYAGDLSFSITYHETAKSMCVTVMGPNHPMTIDISIHLAQALSENGEYSEAEALHRQTVNGLESQFGIHHWRTAIALHRFGETLESQSKWLEAEDMYRRALKARELGLGDNHIDTWLSMKSLTTALVNQRKWAEAADLWLQALRMKKKIFRQSSSMLCSRDRLNCWNKIKHTLFGGGYKMVVTSYASSNVKAFCRSASLFKAINHDGMFSRRYSWEGTVTENYIHKASKRAKEAGRAKRVGRHI